MATYSFLDVVANITGPTGSANLARDAAAADEGISFEPTADINTMQIGAGGSGQHSLHADRSGRVIVRLLKTSPVNALLHQMFDIQRSTASLHGQNIIVCQQKASGDITTATQVAFKKKPSVSYQKEAGLMEWEFDAIRIETVLGTYPAS